MYQMSGSKKAEGFVMQGPALSPFPSPDGMTATALFEGERKSAIGIRCGNCAGPEFVLSLGLSCSLAL